MVLMGTARNQLRILLWLVAVHSFGIGIGLILHPETLLVWVGLAPLTQPFFAVQGGVFHIVMAVGYALAAVDPVRYRCLIVFTVIVKVLATVFLVLYWAVADRNAVVLLSGVADGLMAVVVVWFYLRWRRAEPDIA